MPERIQLSRAKGWRMPPNTVKVARPSRWGNEFRVEVFGRRLAVALFRNTARGIWDPALVQGLAEHVCAEAYQCHARLRERFRTLDIRELHGSNVACFCGLTESCHGDVLLEMANA